MSLGHLFLDYVRYYILFVWLEAVALARVVFAEVMLRLGLTAHLTTVVGVLDEFAWLFIFDGWSFIL